MNFYFYVGLPRPSDAHRFERCCISVNRLRNRKSNFVVHDWILDSGAFTEISTHGYYRSTVRNYADQIRRWSTCGNLVIAVSQDYMCEDFILQRTNLTIADHQKLTIDRYDALIAEQLPTPIMPVLQGYAPNDYIQHIRQYGEKLKYGQWTGVGSVCKRNADVDAIEAVLLAIKSERPDLRLHGFGVKTTALKSVIVRDSLYSADSMAWSFAARKEGRDGNSWREAERFVERIENQRLQPRQMALGV